MVDYFNKLAGYDTATGTPLPVSKPNAAPWTPADSDWLVGQVDAGNQGVIDQITAAMGGTTTVAAPPYTGSLYNRTEPPTAENWTQADTDWLTQQVAAGNPQAIQSIVDTMGQQNPGARNPYSYPTQQPDGSTTFPQQQPGAPNPYMPSGTTNEMVFPAGEDVKPYSGLPESYRDQLLGFLMPQLQSSIGNMEGNIDQYTQNALGTYRQEFNNYVDEEIPKMLRDLAKRGIIDSSVAENAISQTYSDALRKSSGMGYQTAMEAARMKAAIPQSIGGLLQYGQYQDDPTQMYKTLASLLAAQMP